MIDPDIIASTKEIIASKARKLRQEEEMSSLKDSLISSFSDLIDQKISALEKKLELVASK